MRQELCGLDSSDGVLDQAPELLALLVGDGGAQVLNLDQRFADEYDLCDFGDASYPRNQLRIQCQQSVRFLGVAA
jgi:hypothetical protein